MSGFLNIKMPISEQQKFKSWLGGLDVQTQEKAKRYIVNSILKMERRAKTDAPVNKKKKQGGVLRSSIHSQISTDRLGGMVYTNRLYAPYQEFGTGKFAAAFVPTLEQDIQRYAATFKGKGIRKVNVPENPYLFPAWRMAVKELTAQLKELGFKEI